MLAPDLLQLFASLFFNTAILIGIKWYLTYGFNFESKNN